MRIAYLHQYFATPAMPGATRSYEMSRRLVELGHEVHMITAHSVPETKPPGWTVEDVDGITVHWTPEPYSNDMSYPRRIRAFLGFAGKAASRAASVRPDIIFATSTPLTIALPAIYARRRTGAPMVLEVRDLWPEVPIALGALDAPGARTLARSLERLAYRNSAEIVALSPGMKNGILRTGYPEEQVTVIPNGCDFDLFAIDGSRGRTVRDYYPWLGDRPLVVHVGAMGLVNGVDYLVRLAAAVHPIAPDVRFVAVGTGRCEPEVRALAIRLGVLDRNFFMVGTVPKREVPDWLAASSMATSLVADLPALWDASLNKFFDALAAGRPVASNHPGWLASLAEEAGCGVTLDRADFDLAARQLVSALDDADWLAEARGNASRLGRQRFDRHEQARRLEGILERVVARHS